MKITSSIIMGGLRAAKGGSMGLLLAGTAISTGFASDANACAANFEDYKVEVFSHTESAEFAQDPSATIYVPSFVNGYKVLSGGAIVHTMEGDAFLTASYPETDPGSTTPIGWRGETKHMGAGVKGRITTYAIALFDPNDCWDVKVFSASTTEPVAHPANSVSVGAGYVLTGGGAMVPQTASGNGNFLFKSIPNSSGAGWEVQSKDHAVSDPSTITAYAIGIKPKGAGMVTPTSHSLAGKPSASLVNPMADAAGANNIFPGRDCTMTGGGAFDNWTSYGNLLTASYPAGTTTWYGYGRSYGQDDSSIMTAYVVCLN